MQHYSNIKFIILPGYTNSDPEHWQSLWEKEDSHFIRVQQRDWDHPNCKEWADTLQQTIQAINSPVVLIGHSCGTLTIIHWAARYNDANVKGALLVAPADPDGENFVIAATGFTPLPLQSLPFKSILVQSNNDPYVTPEKALFFAKNWGSEFVNIGNKGHINAASGLGNWPEGKNLLNRLLNTKNSVTSYWVF